MTILISVAQLFGCLLAADFLSGVCHWMEDTYGGMDAPAFLRDWVVKDNIEHHRRPNTILNGGWWNCNCVLVVPLGFASLVLFACGVRAWQVFAVLGIASHANWIHRWAHTANVPKWVALLQRMGILQSRRHHALHHASPYRIRFCTTTPMLNPVLDGLHFWAYAEYAVERVLGISPKRLTALREGY